MGASFDGYLKVFHDEQLGPMHITRTVFILSARCSEFRRVYVRVWWLAVRGDRLFRVGLRDNSQQTTFQGGSNNEVPKSRGKRISRPKVRRCGLMPVSSKIDDRYVWKLEQGVATNRTDIFERPFATQEFDWSARTYHSLKDDTPLFVSWQFRTQSTTLWKVWTWIESRDLKKFTL